VGRVQHDRPGDGYFRRHVEAGQPALDLACGTGRLLLPYLRDGLDVDATVAAALTDAEPTGADDFLVFTARRPPELPSGDGPE
jgi:hypothetical protein